MRMRPVAFVLMLVCSSALLAQFEDLATTDDGSILLFATNYRLKFEPELGRHQKIYRWERGFLSRVAMAAGEPYFSGYGPSVYSPGLTGDGSIFWYLRHSGCSVCRVGTIISYSSEIVGVDVPQTACSAASVSISPNGRFLLGTYGPCLLLGPTLTDLQSQQRIGVGYGVVTRHGLADDGSLLIFGGSSPDLFLRNQDGLHLIARAVTGRAALSGNAARAIYARLPSEGKDGELIAVDLATAREEVLATSASDSAVRTFQPSISRDGRRVAFLREVAGIPQAAIWEFGAAVRTLAEEPDGFQSLLLAGGGNLAWASTLDRRLLRIDVNSGEVEEVIPASPVIIQKSYLPALGRLNVLEGSGFSPTLDDMIVKLGSHEVKVLATSSKQLSFEVSGDLRLEGEVELTVSHRNSPFESLLRVKAVSTPAP